MKAEIVIETYKRPEPSSIKPGFDIEYWIQLPDGTYYYGTTVNGIPNGNGMVVVLQDRIIKENDQSMKEKDQSIKEKDQSIKEKDQSIKEKDTIIKEVIYEGGFQEGNYHGTGTRYYNNRKFQEGEFKNGLFVYGIFYHPSGVIQHGTFNEYGNLNSEGKLVLPTGGYLKGRWDNGKPVGEFDVFLGAGREPMKYDFSNKEENTKFNIMLYNNMLFLDDRYLLGPGDIFLFYYNGDIFMGQMNSRTEPVNGVLYKLLDGKYIKMKVGNTRFEGFEIKMSYNENTQIKDCIIQVKGGEDNNADTNRIPFENFDYLNCQQYLIKYFS